MEKKRRKEPCGGRDSLSWKSVVFVLVSLGLAVAPSAATQAKVLTRGYPLPPGGRISVENVRGSIEIEGWDRPVVELKVRKTAPEGCGCLDKASVVAFPARGGWFFHTLYLEDTRAPIRVDYQMMVPRQVQIEELSTVQGEIEVRDVEGTVVAETLNGDIREDGVSGRVSAHSLNGNIEVSLRALPEPGSGLSYETVNGNVSLTLPPRPNADLELKTVAGRVVTPYPLQVSAHPGDRTETCELGHDGISITLKTIRGDIRVTERHRAL